MQTDALARLVAAASERREQQEMIAQYFRFSPEDRARAAGDLDAAGAPYDYSAAVGAAVRDIADRVPRDRALTLVMPCCGMAVAECATAVGVRQTHDLAGVVMMDRCVDGLDETRRILGRDLVVLRSYGELANFVRGACGSTVVVGFNCMSRDACIDRDHEIFLQECAGNPSVHPALLSYRSDASRPFRNEDGAGRAVVPWHDVLEHVLESRQHE